MKSPLSHKSIDKMTYEELQDEEAYCSDYLETEPDKSKLARQVKQALIAVKKRLQKYFTYESPDTSD